MPDTVRLQLEGLHEIEVLELEEDMPAGTLLRPARGDTDPHTYGDLGLTAAVVILTAASINALTIWLAKNRKNTTDELDVEFDQTTGDGVVRLKIRSRTSARSSDAPSAATVEALRVRLEGLLTPPAS